ncbi:hypothetical protein TNCV_2734781 [Trichonephila clavipes]|nr:hypothetical protein TNCV_2734781 [Trichonephila clavipes]
MRFSQSSAQVVPRLMGSCIIPFAMDQPHSLDSHTASSVVQVNQGRAQDLGRGPCVINTLQSPQTLQETKLCKQRLLNDKGYIIVRRDRASGGGGLMFLIRDVHFQRLTDIGNDTL